MDKEFMSWYTLKGYRRWKLDTAEFMWTDPNGKEIEYFEVVRRFVQECNLYLTGNRRWPEDPKRKLHPHYSSIKTL